MAVSFLLLHALVTAAKPRRLKSSKVAAPASGGAYRGASGGAAGGAGGGYRKEVTAASTHDNGEVVMAPIAFSFVLCLFPILWSYSFMYYTDVGSTMSLLACQFLLTRSAEVGTTEERGRRVGPQGGWQRRGDDDEHGKLQQRGGWGAGVAAATAGVMAAFFRQTNAVWVTFLWGAAVLR